MFWFGFAIALSLAAMTAVIAYHLTERTLMGINEALAGLKDQLTEAADEIVAKISELESQITESETVDPQLLDDVKTLAGKLADIVPNAVAGEELTDNVSASVTDSVGAALKPIVPGADLTDSAGATLTDSVGANLSGVRVSGAALTDSAGATLTDAVEAE